MASCSAFALAGCAPSESGETSSTIEPTIPVDVVVISGQSNAVGCSDYSYLYDTMGADKYREYANDYPEIQIAFDSYTKDENKQFFSQNASPRENFTDVKLGQGNSTLTFGPEIGIAETLHERYANKLFLIKFACGASNLKDDWMNKTSPMYPKMMDYIALQVQHLKAKGYIPTIRAFCWMQGEGDAWLNYYETYFDNLSTFAANVRADLRQYAGGKDVPFIDAGISDSEQWQYYREVNEAKVRFAALSDNNIYIDTIEEGLHTHLEPTHNPDTAHYDSASMIELGHLFANAFEPFLSK